MPPESVVRDATYWGSESRPFPVGRSVPLQVLCGIETCVRSGGTCCLSATWNNALHSEIAACRPMLLGCADTSPHMRPAGTAVPKNREEYPPDPEQPPPVGRGPGAHPAVTNRMQLSHGPRGRDCGPLRGLPPAPPPFYVRPPRPLYLVTALPKRGSVRPFPRSRPIQSSPARVAMIQTVSWRFRHYEKAQRNTNKIDFDDQKLRPWERMRASPNAHRQQLASIKVVGAGSACIEAKSIVTFIKKVRTGHKALGFSEFIVLYRTNAQSLPIQVEFILNDVRTMYERLRLSIPIISCPCFQDAGARRACR